MSSSIARPLTSRWQFAGCLFVSALTACGGLTVTPAPSGDHPTAGALPEPPPLSKRLPYLVDKEGCVRIAPDLVDCGAPPPPSGAPVEPSSDPDRPRNLLGFDGPYYTDAPSGGRAAVLEETVRLPTAGTWEARGLVRNESTTAALSVTVKAVLRDATGTVLARVEVTPLLNAQRPGEPAPFHATSDVAVEDVDSVVWSATGVGVAMPLDRSVEVSPFGWELAAGDRERYSRVDPKFPPYPYVTGGHLMNVGSTVIDSPIVIGAWIQNGTVLWIDTTHVRRLVPGEPPLQTFEPGTRGDYFFAVDEPEVASALDDAVPDSAMIVWVTGSR